MNPPSMLAQSGPVQPPAYSLALNKKVNSLQSTSVRYSQQMRTVGVPSYLGGIFVVLLLFQMILSTPAQAINTIDRTGDDGSSQVFHDGRFMDKRLADLAKGNHKGFFSGLISPIKVASGFLASHLRSKPMGYGSDLGEFFEVTWSMGSILYRTGFVIGVPLTIIAIFTLMGVVGSIIGKINSE